MLITIGLWVIIALMVNGCIKTITQIGQPKKTSTPKDAAIATVFNALFLFILISAAVARI
jgi:hypothetical protein